MPKVYMAVTFGLSGCYMPDTCYPVCIERRCDLAELIRDELNQCEWPESLFREVGIRDWWQELVAGKAWPVSLYWQGDDGYTLAFSPLSEEDFEENVE